MIVGLLMVTGAFVAAAAPTAAWHSNMPVVYEETVDGSGAFGVGTTVQESGDVAVALTGWAPAESATISAGVVVYDEDKNHRFTFAFTAHGSPDRTIVEPTPSDPTPTGSWDEGTWTTQADGDLGVLEDVDIKVDVFEPLPEDHTQPLIRVATTSPDADTGDLYRAAWVGDVSETTLEIESDASLGDVEAVAGPAYVMGDADIEDGTPNIQIQDSSTGTTIGAKVMNDATVEIDADNGLTGFWGLSDFKLACQFDAGACLWATTVYGTCAYELGVNCSPGQISWQGPDSGGDGSTLYSMSGTAPGAHSFTVDHKIDLYGPSEYDADSGTYASLGEHFSYLTVADVALP